MNPRPPRFQADDPGAQDADVSGKLPCAGGLIAGTLALMTTWASPAAQECELPRSVLARKIVSNLFFLRHHPQLGEPLRRVMGKVHERWLELAQAAPQVPADSPRAPHWH